MDINVHFKVNDKVKKMRDEELFKIYNGLESTEANLLDLNLYFEPKGIQDNIKNEIYLRSEFNNNIILTEEQYKCIEILEKDNLLLSAPTSFGKTFVTLEYIKRNEQVLNNIIVVVPTIALMNELVKKISKAFLNYNIIMNSDEHIAEKNIFIMVAERNGARFLSQLNLKKVEIDLLVIDEFYKLSRKEAGERIISMNASYFKLAPQSKKIILLTPFTRNVKFERKLFSITKYITNYSPVLNNVQFVNGKWLDYCIGESNLIYFETPQNILKQKSILSKETINLAAEIKDIIKWLKLTVYEHWDYIYFLERGYAIHHGATPIYLRKFFEKHYELGNIKFMFCTSTLAEGINTPTDNLIIAQGPNSPFKLNNIIGRVGRLNVNNPKIGSIYITDQNMKDIYDPNFWSDINIVAEDLTNVVDEDEVLHLGKKDDEKENNIKLEFKRFCQLLNISESELENFDVKFEIVKKINERYYEIDNSQFKAKAKLVEEWSNKKATNFLVSGQKIIPFKKFYMFECSRFDVKSKYSYISYNGYIWNILFDKEVIESVNAFKEYNDVSNADSINKFIDSYFMLENYVKHEFVNILPYLELFKNILPDNGKELEEKLIKHLRVYSVDRNLFERILLDLGIHHLDCKKLTKLLSRHIESQNISTRTVIEELKANNYIYYNNLTEISKSNLDGLFN